MQRWKALRIDYLYIFAETVRGSHSRGYIHWTFRHAVSNIVVPRKASQSASQSAILFSPAHFDYTRELIERPSGKIIVIVNSIEDQAARASVGSVTGGYLDIRARTTFPRQNFAFLWIIFAGEREGNSVLVARGRCENATSVSAFTARSDSQACETFVPVRYTSKRIRELTKRLAFAHE